MNSSNFPSAQEEQNEAEMLVISIFSSPKKEQGEAEIFNIFGFFRFIKKREFWSFESP